MIVRRHVVKLALAAVAVAWLSPSSAQAPGFQRFVPLLIDLDGWKGEKADGMSMQMGGTSMDAATRKYERGEASIDVQVMVGPAAQAALAPTQAGIKIETPNERMSTSSIDGFVVLRTYQINDKSGGVIVALSNNAAFSLTFNGITDEDALALAKKFNWKAIQAAAK
jgi:hypothetical protein